MNDDGEAGLEWVQCDGVVAYPVIEVDFLDASKGRFAPVFFDTGARYNYISEGMLGDLEVPITATHYRRSSRDVGRAGAALPRNAASLLDFYFREVDLNIAVSAGGSTFEGNSLFRVVADWKNSPLYNYCRFGQCDGAVPLTRPAQFECPNRVGLLSSQLVKDLGLKVELNGGLLQTRLSQS